MRQSFLLVVVLCAAPEVLAADLVADLAAREYHVSRLEQGWQAPNRAQGIRTSFHVAGIRVVPRTGPAGAPRWTWGITPVRWGRAGQLAPLETASPRAEGPRVDYDRGPIGEWYLNAPKGLEQGFTLLRPPEGAGPVQLEMDLTGTLLPTLSQDGQAVDFAIPGGERVLRYAELAVRDARDAIVPAHMELFWGGLRIILDDADAVYPITVDPIITGPAFTVEGDSGGAHYGNVVASAGDVNGDGYADLLVGAPTFDNGQASEGRVFLYLGSPSGLSTTPAWTVESNQAGAQLGTSVASAGDINGDGYADVLVGTPYFQNTLIDEGRVTLYLGSAGGLPASPSWTAYGGQAGARLGFALGTAGDVNGDGFADVLVGAPFFDNGQADEGRALVYLGSPAGLGASPVWTAEADQVNAQFGASVGTAGDVNGDGFADVIVGAPTYDGAQVDGGRAFVYHGGAGGPSSGPAWFGGLAGTGNGFGYAVATAGDLNADGYADVIVGTPLTFRGLVSVYLGSSSGLAAAPQWSQDNWCDAVGQFGYSVAPAGDVNGDGFADVLIGAPRCFNQGLGGEVYGVWWVLQGSRTGLSGYGGQGGGSSQNLDLVGTSVAAAGDVNGDGYGDIAIGSPRYDNGLADEGRVQVYLGSANTPSLTSGWSVESNQVSAQLGSWVASAGDVNGDGYADVVVGAARFDNGQNNEGKALLYLGSPNGVDPAQPPAWSAEGNQADALYGFRAGNAGDINGDGYDDLVVGAPNYTNTQLQEGRVFVYNGSAAGPSVTPSWTADGGVVNGQLASTVAGAGDVNGDGYADLLVASPVWSGGGTQGRAVVYLGSANGLASTPAWSVIGPANAAFAAAGGSAGDVNGDGFSDVILGAFNDSNGQTNEGRAYVYLGSATGLATAPVWTAESNQVSALMGWSVAAAGDVDGDGFGDVIVGSYLYDNGQTDEGRAWLFRGAASGPLAAASWILEPNAAGAQLGIAVASAGDVNGDGFADVLVSQNVGGSGRVSVHLGSGTGLSMVAAWSLNGVPGENFGAAVASAGDVNGDGYADMLVGSPNWGNGQGSEGRTLLFYGNDSPDGKGTAARPRQLRSFTSDPIAHLGASDASRSFQLGLLGKNPFGRGPVGLQAEARPVGTPFSGVPTHSAPLADSGVSGISFELPVTNLSPAVRYHWRVRTIYEAARTPLLAHGPWRTMPWGAWTETMLRTAQDSAAEVTNLVMGKSPGVLTLDWNRSCLFNEIDWAIYEGTIGNWGASFARACSTNQGNFYSVPVPSFSAFYLVVPKNGGREGSYGKTSAGLERPPAVNACLPQNVAACP